MPISATNHVYRSAATEEGGPSGASQSANGNDDESPKPIGGRGRQPAEVSFGARKPSKRLDADKPEDVARAIAAAEQLERENILAGIGGLERLEARDMLAHNRRKNELANQGDPIDLNLAQIEEIADAFAQYVTENHEKGVLAEKSEPIYGLSIGFIAQFGQVHLAIFRGDLNIHKLNTLSSIKSYIGPGIFLKGSIKARLIQFAENNKNINFIQ